MQRVREIYEQGLIDSLVRKFKDFHDDIRLGLVDPNTIRVSNPGWTDGEFVINISAAMKYDDGDVDFYGEAFASPALPIEYWWVP